MSDELKKYDNRAGYKLVSCQEVGLPVYKLLLEVSMLVSKSIAPIEEFILRSMDAGLASVYDICGFLGLDLATVQDAMANLIRNMDIDLLAAEGSINQEWKITSKGRKTLQDAKTEVPTEQTIEIYFDGLLRRPYNYGSLGVQFLKPKNLRDFQIIEIEPSPSKPPILSDLKLSDIDEYIKKSEQGNKSSKRKNDRDLLSLRAIKGCSNIFMPAKALIYKELPNGESFQIGFLCDNRPLIEHEDAFAAVKSPKKLNILESLKASDPYRLAEEVLGRSFIDQPCIAEIEKVKENIAKQESKLQLEVNEVRGNLNIVTTNEEKKQLQEELETALRTIEELKSQLNNVLSSAPVRWLEVYEHRPILEKALQTANRRLMIISPWIRSSSTDRKLIRDFDALLSRGVKVFIGYGLGETAEDKREQDIRAEKEIKNLANKYKENFFLKRLGDTHAKVLISDSEFAVVTSFNWLSFKGDPVRKFRDERGVYVSNEQKIQELYDDYMKRFDSNS